MSVKALPAEKLKFYEEILLKERETGLNIIKAITSGQQRGDRDAAGDLSSYSIHQADQGTDTDNMETQVYLLEEQQKKVKKINKALRRIHDKSYGICEISGEYISESRLKAVPFARYSMATKEKEEKRHRG